jgi:hypothetical protein
MNSIKASFGKADRFFDKDKPDFGAIPGPGAYNNEKAWTKKTYNLRFLNY